MWTGILSAAFGAIIGGGVTYFVQRQLEAERRHERTLEKLYGKVAELSKMITILVAGPVFGEEFPYPEEARDIAREIELLATDLEDEDLKREIIRTMNREYESPEEICWQFEQIELELRERAYPTLYEIEEEGRKAPAGLAARQGQDSDVPEWTQGWKGPATYQFLLRLKESGITLRVEEKD
jgi:hypothetical protein